MYNIVKQVRNYGDSFERNVGKNTPLKLEHGLNALWHQRWPDVRDPVPLRRDTIAGLQAPLPRDGGAIAYDSKQNSRHPDRAPQAREVEGSFVVTSTKRNPSTTPPFGRLRSG